MTDSAELSAEERVIYLMSLGFKQEEAAQLLLKDHPDCLSFVTERYGALEVADAQTRNQYVDLCTVLEGDMLTKVDRASMLASVETRVPMLSRDVVELSYRIPTEYKINRKKRKIILKDTFRDLIPKELFSAPKHGFAVPIGLWLRTELREKLYAYVDREFVEEQGLFDAEYIHGVVDEHILGLRDRASELWSFFVFQDWYWREIVGEERL